MHIFGKYILFLREAFVRNENFRTVFHLFIEEAIKIGNKSIFIVFIIAFFTGAVSTIQTAYNLAAPYLEDFIIGLAVRDMILGITPTLIGFVFAGKVGSHIAGELGNMRISEQVDALEVMGINSISYLVQPRITASVMMLPLLMIFSCFVSLLGGYLTAVYANVISGADYTYGIRYDFVPLAIYICIIKAVVFGFLVSSISAFKGFYTEGGAFQVGRSGTLAAVSSCIAIVVSDYFLTQMFAGI